MCAHNPKVVGSNPAPATINCLVGTREGPDFFVVGPAMVLFWSYGIVGLAIAPQAMTGDGLGRAGKLSLMLKVSFVTKLRARGMATATLHSAFR